MVEVPISSRNLVGFMKSCLFPNSNKFFTRKMNYTVIDWNNKNVFELFVTTGLSFIVLSFIDRYKRDLLSPTHRLALIPDFPGIGAKI